MLVSPIAVLSLWALGPDSLSQQSLSQSLSQQSLSQQLVVAALSVAISLFALVPGMLLPPVCQSWDPEGSSREPGGAICDRLCRRDGNSSGVYRCVGSGWRGITWTPLRRTKRRFVMSPFRLVFGTCCQPLSRSYCWLAAGRHLDQPVNLPAEPTQGSPCQSRCQPPGQPRGSTTAGLLIRLRSTFVVLKIAQPTRCLLFLLEVQSNESVFGRSRESRHSRGSARD